MVRSAKIFEKDRATQEFEDTGVVIFEDGRVEGGDETLQAAYKELLHINLKRNNSWGQILKNFSDGYKKAVEVRDAPAGKPAPPAQGPQSPPKT
jgi:hypothetical protein